MYLFTRLLKIYWIYAIKMVGGFWKNALSAWEIPWKLIRYCKTRRSEKLQISIDVFCNNKLTSKAFHRQIEPSWKTLHCKIVQFIEKKNSFSICSHSLFNFNFLIFFMVDPNLKHSKKNLKMKKNITKKLSINFWDPLSRSLVKMLINVTFQFIFRFLRNFNIFLYFLLYFINSINNN